MKSERQKMLDGELYDPMDAELVAGRERARDLCWELNATRDADQDQRRRILCELLGVTRVVHEPKRYGKNEVLMVFNNSPKRLGVAPHGVGDYRVRGSVVAHALVNI